MPPQDIINKVSSQSSQPRAKIPEEKLKFLKREEINTMQKDVSRLREAEAADERQKVSKIKSSEELKKDQERKAKEQKEREKQEELKKESEKIKQVSFVGSPDNEASGHSASKIVPAVPQTKPAVSQVKSDLKPAIETKETERKEQEFSIPEKQPESKKDISKEFEKLAEEKRRTERDLSWLPEEKTPLEKELGELQTEIENIQSSELGPVLREERKIEDEKRLIEEQEKEADFQSRQTIETKRWEIERKRKEIEQQKWQIEEKIDERDQKIKKIKIKLAEIANKEKELAGNIQNISEKAKGEELQQERSNLQKALTAINADLEGTEKDFQILSTQKSADEKTLNEILISEKALEEEISILEAKESKAANLAEQKEIEQKRWETDRIRKETEEEKWQQQTKNKEVSRQIISLGTDLEKKRQEKIKLENKIKEIDIFLEKIGIKIPEPEIEPREPKRESEKEMPFVMPAPPAPPPIFRPEQKIPVPVKEIEQKPPSSLKRILIRLLPIVLLIGVAGSLSWFFIIKDRLNPPVLPPSPSQSPTPSASLEPTGTPEPIPPQALININNTKIITVKEYAESQDIFFSSALQGNNQELIRILIKDDSENRFWGLKEFLGGFAIAAPNGFYDKVDNNFTLFVHTASNSEPRLGFVAKINDKEGLNDLMKNWEKTMEKDFNGLFTTGLKFTQPPASHVFRNAYFKKQAFRYQTFTKNDFGICYGIIDDYLVFTTSGKSMLRIIDLLQTN